MNLATCTRMFGRFTVAAVTACLLTPTAHAEPRKFQVFLMNPRAQWVAGGEGFGLPVDEQGDLLPNMMPNPGDIEEHYFDVSKNGVGNQERIDSFKEWWTEVSYGNVIVEGSDVKPHVHGWLNLPWPISPQNNSEDSLTPEDFVDLADDGENMRFGRGENFNENYAMLPIDFLNNDLPPDGAPPQLHPDPIRDDVWTPGERFMDLAEDGRCDALWEPWLGGSSGDMNGDGVVNDLFMDPSAIGEQDCEELHQDALERLMAMPVPTCTIPCVACDPEDFLDTNDNLEKDFPEPFEDYLVRRDRSISLGPQPEWYIPVTDDYIKANYPGDVDALLARSRWSGAPPTPPPAPCSSADQCNDSDPSTTDTCAGNLCCHTPPAAPFVELGNNRYDPPEQWTPSADFDDATDFTNVPLRNIERVPNPIPKLTPEPSWYRDFWKGRYGKVGNDVPTWPVGGVIPRFEPYDPEEVITDDPQDLWLRFNPNKGGLSGYGVVWEQMLRAASYDPCLTQPGETPTTCLAKARQFCKARNDSMDTATPLLFVSPMGNVTDCMCDNWTPKYGNGSFPPDEAGPILPTPEFNYCGPKEYDDLPSSIYHSRWTMLNGQAAMVDYGGSQTFGEVTSSDPYPEGSPRRNFGDDRTDLPWGPGVTIDGIILPAGPLAGGDVFFPGGLGGPFGKPVTLHGAHLADGGNILTLEFLTRVTDGDKPGRSRPIDQQQGNNIVGEDGTGGGFQRPSGSPYAPPGFADFDLDGMIDLGEGVRDDYTAEDDGGDLDTYHGVENYSFDADDSTANDGVQGAYPYNRERMIEDVIALIDPTFDFRDQVNTGGITPISGITLLPGGMGGPAGDAHTFLGTGEATTDVGVFSVPAGSGVDTPMLDFMTGGYDGILPCPGDYALVPTPTRLVSARRGVNNMAICLDRGHPQNVEAAYEGRYKTTFAAHEYGHIWEGWPDLYDYDTLYSGPEEAPVGGFDIMAGARDVGLLPFVHTMPLSKAQSGWIDPIDLTTVLTPLKPTPLILVSVEGPYVSDPANGVGTYWYFPNQFFSSTRERFDFYHVSDTRDNTGNEPKFGNEYPWGDEVVYRGVDVEAGDLGFDDLEERRGDVCEALPDGSGPTSASSNVPDGGMLILHSDVDVEFQGLPPQQVDPGHTTYIIVQADGQDDMSGILPPGPGNSGDNADFFTGTCEKTVLNYATEPNNRWWTGGASGIEIEDVQNFPVDPSTGFGSSRVTFKWIPQDTASLTFHNLAASQSMGSIFRVDYDAFDQYGGTRMHLYVDTDDDELVDFDGVELLSQLKGAVVGEKFQTGFFTVNLNALPNGEVTARFYAFLEPVPGAGTGGQSELTHSIARPGQNNTGNGSVTFAPTDIKLINGDSTSARAEGWTLALVNETLQQWTVTGSESGLQLQNASDPNSPPLHAVTGVTYPGTTNPEGAVKFRINAGSVPFKLGDTFVFTTTGWTRYSGAIEVINYQVNPGPEAVISVIGSATGLRPLTVTFDGGNSVNPNGSVANMLFEWDFGDGSQGTGLVTEHTYTQKGVYDVSLTVTNELVRTHMVLEENLVAVLSNPPMANLTTTPSPAHGSLPLLVTFTASGSDPIDGDLMAKYEFDYQFPCVDGETFNPADFVANATFNTTAASKVVSQVYSSVFNGCAAVRVTDSGGDQRVAAVTVNAGNLPPTAVIKANGKEVASCSERIAGNVPFEVTFDAGGSTDPDQDTLTYRWYFSKAALDAAAPDATTKVATHTFTKVGSNLVTLVVRDPDEASSSACVNIDVVLGSGNVVTINSISATPSSGLSPLKVAFSASASSQNAGSLTYRWELGDAGIVKFGQNVSYTYRVSGTQEKEFKPKLVVSDSTGAQAVRQLSVKVSPTDSGGLEDPNLVANLTVLTGDPSGEAPLLVQFSTAGSQSLDGSPVTVLVDFDDGTPVTKVLPGGVVMHTYLEAGEYEPTATVIDEASGGQAVSEPVVITVDASGRPAASVSVDASSGFAPLTVRFDASGSTDPEGQPLTYVWDFGDDTPTATGEQVTHTFFAPEVYTVTLTASDSTGTSDISTMAITVQEAPGGEAPEPVPPVPGQEDPDSPGVMCGQGCGSAGASQLLLMLISLLGLRWRRRVQR